MLIEAHASWTRCDCHNLFQRVFIRQIRLVLLRDFQIRRTNIVVSLFYVGLLIVLNSLISLDYDVCACQFINYLFVIS